MKLVLHAKIREPLSVLVKKNEISLGPEETFVGEVEVCNFTDNEWAGVQVSPSVDWLTVDAISDSPPENPSGVGEPLQGWRIHYKVSAEALGFGYHRALLDVDAGELSKSLNLVFQVRSPVVVIPSEFLFLSVDPQKGATESLTLRTKDHEVTPTMVTLTPVDVPVGFAFEVTRANELLTLTGTIPPGVESGSVSGHVELTFEGVSLPSIRIPVRAIVR